MVYEFDTSHAATISSDKKEFSGAEDCDTGPSYARCQPIENNPIIFEDDGISSTLSNLPAMIIFKIVTKAYRYAECSVGIHSNVDHFYEFLTWKNTGQFITRYKSRVGYEVSVHGHRVFDKYQRRTEDISSNVTETKNESEDAKDWIDKEWADGDVIKLVFDNPKLTWWWNGIEQSCIDVSEENERMVSEILKGRSKNRKVGRDKSRIETLRKRSKIRKVGDKDVV